MSAREQRYAFNLSLLFVVLALAAFVAGLCVAEGWLTKGSVWEWAFAGLIASTLAKLPL